MGEEKVGREAKGEGRNEVETRVLKKIEEKEKEGKKEQCVVFTDSNGRNVATPDSIKSHILEEECANYEVSLVITYRIEEAVAKVQSGQTAVNGAIVLIDCLSNNSRQTKNAPQISPNELTDALDTFQKQLWDSDALNIIVCALRPTQR